MSESNRVQRWREAKRQAGKKGVMIWLDEAEELRLKDAALTWHCSPSEMLGRAWAQFHPGQPSGIGNETDTLQLRQLIREELAAMQTPQPPVTDTVTVMVTETPVEEPTVATMAHVTDTSTGSVTDTEAAAPPPKRTRPGPRGISHAQHEAIVAEYHRCGQPPYAKFAQHLYATGVYRATAKDGTAVPVSTSALYRWIQHAREAGML